jgi:hypothetical protein
MTASSRSIAKPILRLGSDSAVQTVVPLFIVLRIVTLIVAYWTVNTFPARVNWAEQPIHYLHDIALGGNVAVHPWIEPWYRWDTGWYIYIAHGGYHSDDGSIIFPPLYPLAIHLTAMVLGDGNHVAASLIVSNLAVLAALILFYKIVESEFGKDLARRALIFYLIFPSAFFLVAGYSESLFLALLLGAWLAVKQEKFLIAGFLALLASLTRSQGWTLFFPFVYMVFIQPGWKQLDIKLNRREFVCRIFAVIGGPMGTLLYLFGMSLAGLGHVNEAFDKLWAVKIVAPWTSVSDAIQVILDGKITFHDLISLGTLSFLIGMSVLAIKYLKPAYVLYLWSTLAFILMRSYQPTEYEPTQFLGLIRYALSLFPVFIMLARIFHKDTATSQRVRNVYLVFSAAVQIVLLVMFAESLWVA